MSPARSVLAAPSASERRNGTVDCIKGLAICLVLWGHCIQFLDPQSSFFGDRVFQSIYSFHMPLFMAVSGYLFGMRARSLSGRDHLIKRTKQLLVPFFVWSLLVGAAWTVFGAVAGRGIRIHNTLEILWFLPALFFCVLVSVICEKAGHPLAYFLAIVLSLLLPDWLGLDYAKFMLPYFVAGILFWRYSCRIPPAVKGAACIAALAVWCVMVWNWRQEYYIYTSGMSLYVADIPHKLFVVCYRFAAGFAGIIWVSTAVDWLHRRVNLSPLERVGRYTMGIYILSVFANPFLSRLGVNTPVLIYDWIATPIAACVICLATVYLTKLINRRRFISKVLLGV